MTAAQSMSAQDVLDALQRWGSRRRAAIVPELVIGDDYGTWKNELGRGTDEPREPETRRLDALMFQTLVRTAIEIKVTRADAARETWLKVWPWQRVCHRFVYVVPAGLIELAPVSGCGLWWVHPGGGIEVVQKTTISKTPEPLPQCVVQQLAFRAARHRCIADTAPCQGDLQAGSHIEDLQNRVRP
ncbi:hypothetical protein [Mycobacteroides abscessus]|uniref:hypothetical protein n=1 Tax=Mycobacteroides abscessus TaxID=36809 RepID=UPI00192E5C45|nr:hypothetical protein [Mycobacteroides abscessus]